VTELEEQPVADQLRAWAGGMYPVEAAVELLLRAFGGRFSQPGREWIVPTEHGRYYVDFAQIPVSIGALSGGEQGLPMIRVARG